MSDTTEPLALAIVVKGEVVSSNLPEFRDAVKFFVGAINRDLVTDDQFNQADVDAKRLKALEEAIAAAKQKALADAVTLHALFTALDDSSEEIRKTRLDLENQIKRQKESVKSQLVADALNKVDCAPHLRLKTYGSIVENAIKGKRTLDSMEKALSQIVGSLNEQLAATKAVIAEWEAANEICPDAETLALEPAETVRLKLQQRTQARIAAEEKKRLAHVAEEERQKRIAAEAEAKAAQAPPAVAPVVVNETPVRETQAPLSYTRETQAPAPSAAEVATEDEAAERARFVAIVRQAFVPIKEARAALKFPNNRTAALAFTNGVLEHWETLSKGGAK